jgi:hypothetical protein
VRAAAIQVQAPGEVHSRETVSLLLRVKGILFLKTARGQAARKVPRMKFPGRQEPRFLVKLKKAL